MHSFPATPEAGAIKRERRFFAPDELGAPPNGWKWVGSIATAPIANATLGDTQVSVEEDPVSNFDVVFHSNGVWGHSAALDVLSSLNGVGFPTNWQDGFTPTRFVAAWSDYDAYLVSSAENAGRKVVLIARGTVSGADTVCAQVYTCDEFGAPQLTSQSLYDCASGEHDVAEGYQAFAFIDGKAYVKAISTAFGIGSGFFSVDMTTGELAWHAAGGTATSSSLVRLIAASGALCVFECRDGYTRARSLMVDPETGVVSSTRARITAFSPQLDSVAANYDASRPRRYLAFEAAPGVVMVVTKYGLTRVVESDEPGGYTCAQVAASHEFAQELPFKMSSFSAVLYEPASDLLTFTGMKGFSFLAFGGMRLVLSDYTDMFERRAEKL